MLLFCFGGFLVKVEHDQIKKEVIGWASVKLNLFVTGEALLSTCRKFQGVITEESCYTLGFFPHWDGSWHWKPDSLPEYCLLLVAYSFLFPATKVLSFQVRGSYFATDCCRKKNLFYFLSPTVDFSKAKQLFEVRGWMWGLKESWRGLAAEGRFPSDKLCSPQDGYGWLILPNTGGTEIIVAVNLTCVCADWHRLSS